MLFIGLIIGIIITYLLFYFLIDNMKSQIEKLRGQVYYWSRQMPVGRKKRPVSKSV